MRMGEFMFDFFMLVRVRDEHGSVWVSFDLKLN